MKIFFFAEMKSSHFLTWFWASFFVLHETQTGFSQNNFLQQVSGPNGGPVRAIAGNSHGDIFVGIENNGVFRSRDGGVHWLPINNGLPNSNVLSFLIDARHKYL